MKNEMQYRELGNSGLKASVFGLGTFAIGGWFWGGTDEKDSIKAIQGSIDNGVNLIDTAPIYGYGLSEEIVGKALKGRRDRAIIATKGGLVWNTEKGDFHTHADDAGPTGEPSKYKIYQYLGPESLRQEVEDSLKRLQTDYIDLYQTHWQDSTTPIEETMGALNDLKKQGKIKAIGVCNVTPEQLKEYRKYGNIVSVQEKFSLIDRAVEKKGLVDYCVENNLSILSYFTIEQGLLSGKMSPSRKFDDGDTRKGNPLFSAENVTKVNSILKELEPFAKKYEVNLIQLVIALTAAQRGITHVLIGARNEKQARENLVGGEIHIDPNDLKDMNKIAEKLQK